MRAIKHILILCLLLMAARPGYAQYRTWNKAYELFMAKKLDSAKIYIDSVVIHPETSKDYNSWMLKGFIYKELYKAKEMHDHVSPLREKAVESYMEAIMLDTAGKNEKKASILQSIKYLAAQYHNDIQKTLDTLNYLQSIKNAEKYKSLTKFLDPSFNEKRYDYDLYLTLGSMFESNYEKHDTKNCLDLAKVYLFKAYDLDSSTFKVNKNLGLLYYNQAVTIIKMMDYDIPLDQLPVYQDKAIKLAKQAEPYLLKAHALDAKDRAVLEALAGIYYLLNDNEKHNYYKMKLEELNKE